MKSESTGVTAAKETVKGLLIIVVVILVLALAIRWSIAGVLEIAIEVLSALSSMDVAVVVALVTGCVSIVTVVLGSILSSYLSYKQREQEYLRQHREVAYQQLVSTFVKVVKSPKVKEEYSQTEMLDDFYDFTEKLMLWGSADAIKLWAEWRIHAGRNPSARDLMLGQEKIIMQLRKDMGQKKKPNQGDILKLLINDVDENVLNKK